MTDASSPKLDEFATYLPSLCGYDTTADQLGWTMRNPLWGHCAVVALAVQDRFGGELMRASLEPFPKFSSLHSHYWNRLPDGSERDLTREQFGDDPPPIQKAETRSRAYVLYNASTMERYQRLSWRLARHENRGHTLFSNNIYRHCYMAAMASPCQTMRFGCLLLSGEHTIVAESCNTDIPAEELAIRIAVRDGIRPAECELYVVGVRADGTPWFLKESADYTCLRAARLMHEAGIPRLFVPVGDHWETLTTAQAVLQAHAYAAK